MRLIISIAIVAVVIWLLHYLSDVLLPFFTACVIAYMLRPLVELNLRKLHLKRYGMAVFLTILEITIILAGILYLIIPTVITEVNSLSQMVHTYSEHRQQLPAPPNFVQDYFADFNIDKLSKLVESGKISGLVDKGSSLIAVSIETVLHTLEWMLMFIYIIFILLDYDEITNGFKKIAPVKYRSKVMQVVGDVEDAMNHYFRGQGLLALCAMVFYCIGFSLVGLPMAIIMGILVGALYMIPYFQYITLIPVAAICFITSLNGEVGFWTELGKCGAVYVVSQCICDYVLTPRIMGKEMGLNPAIILLSLSVWGSLLGILGMIIALPATALLISYYERYISNRGAEQKIQ